MALFPLSAPSWPRRVQGWLQGKEALDPPSFRLRVSVPVGKQRAAWLPPHPNPSLALPLLILPTQSFPAGPSGAGGAGRAGGPDLESPAALTEGLYELVEWLVTSQNFQKPFEFSSLEMFALKSLSFSVLGNKMCPSREMKLL